jgi:phospholipid-translocating ATPase
MIWDSIRNTPGFSRRPTEHGDNEKAWTYGAAVQHAKLWEIWAINCLASFGLFTHLLKSSAHGRQIPLTVHHQLPLIDKRTGRPYISNRIHSSRYNIWDFLPKQLLFQTTRLSNFYLICIGIPQAIPGLSPTGSFTTILPLLVFLVLTISKEGWDDFRRHRLDKVENNQETFVLRERHDVAVPELPSYVSLLRSRTISKTKMEVLEESAEEVKAKLCWKHVKWHNVKVGDIIRLRRDDPVPADIVILSATGESGTAFIETTALDGETNFKNKQAITELQCCDTVEGIDLCEADFHLEDPNPDLYNFEGRVTVVGKTVPLTLNEVIFRGSVIRNTDTVFGLVVNTGEDTKIRMNANQHPPAKKPRLEKFSNQIVMTLFLYVIILTAGCSFGYWLWQRSTERHSWYLNEAAMAWKEIIIGFAIEFNNVIPLALYVSLEIVKIGQALSLNSDLEMYDEDTDTRMTCNTNTILENLGQVSIVLSDKTGTLTENVMQFQKLSICGVSFGMDGSGKTGSEDETTQLYDGKAHAVDKNSSVATDLPEMESVLPNCRSDEMPIDTLLSFVRKNGESAFSTKASQFITAMAICNNCLPESRAGSINYQASSPDELALVKAARDFGYCLIERSSASAQLLLEDPDGHEKNQIYEILDIIEFSSKRKRMSIIVKTPDGQIRLICKGADSVILSRLKNSETAVAAAEDLRVNIEIAHDRLRRSEQLRRSTDFRQSIDLVAIRRSFVQHSTEIPRTSSTARNVRTEDHLAVLEKSWARDDHDVLSHCLRHIHDYANDGLRTLAFAQRVIAPEEYNNWKKLYHAATTTLENRQERIEEAAELIEQSLDLLGATAIEDKLQAGVPETIQRLRRANIRIWMLTGDKRETAINIAHSARLCLQQSDIFDLDESKEPLQDQLNHIAERLRTDCVHSVVVIDGHTLSAVESDPSLKSTFYSLIPIIDSAICCRATPAQKAGVVRAIRSEVPQGVTLAIGDGANDIAMIQASVLFSFLTSIALANMHSTWVSVSPAKKASKHPVSQTTA